MDITSILAGRLMRQGLSRPVSTNSDYRRLFASLQPVSPVCFSRPGDPPSLVHRTTFDDREVTSAWRETREIVKGRFLNGTIGYVFSEELELYANAFQHPMERFDRVQQVVYDALNHVGPLTPRQIKDETGLLNKEIMPALHRLQEAFLVYEDQVDTDWERAWYVFSEEWPEITVEPDRCETAAREVLRRFIHAHLFVSAEQIKDWSGWPLKDIRHVLCSMHDDGDIVPCTVDGLGKGWVGAADTTIDVPGPSTSVFMLHKADPIVRANMSELKRAFESPEVLQYLLVDGDFQGAVLGHWRIGPHDVDDIVVQLPPDECMDREAEITEAVEWIYHPPSHRILRYNGERIAM